MNIGGSNRTIYDDCQYKKQLKQSTKPLEYALYQGKFEHCERCVHEKLYTPYDLVDIESELRNQTRPLSNCPENKYSPTCEKSDTCVNTFDKSVPVVFAPEVCPIVHNNIPKQTSPGYSLPDSSICKKN